MKIFLTILFCTLSTIAIAQQKTLARFIITDASHNNIDVTETYLDVGGIYRILYQR